MLPGESSTGNQFNPDAILPVMKKLARPRCCFRVRVAQGRESDEHREVAVCRVGGGGGWGLVGGAGGVSVETQFGLIGGGGGGAGGQTQGRDRWWGDGDK